MKKSADKKITARSKKQAPNDVFFGTHVPKESADKFDAIAAKNFRSRADQLRFCVDKEIEFHENKTE